MASDTSSNFYYFAYGTYADAAELQRSLAAVSGGAVPIIHSARPALLPGYRLVFDAVSAEGPRLGCINIAPLSLVARDPSTARLSPSKDRDGKSHEYKTAFRDGVRGILYELSATVREPLLLAVAREGSFNMYAMLTCYAMSDVHRAVRAPDSPMFASLVVAALDMPLMERKFSVEALMQLRWQPLPKPQGVQAQPGLVAVVASSPAGTPNGAASTPQPRWPGLHWCNCIHSVRVAPSQAYAALLEKAYREYIHLNIAANQDGSSSTAVATHSSASSDSGDADLYATAIHRMVYQQACNVSKDSQEVKTWYLAYGSNMSWEQVCVRIGPPYQRRPAKLLGYVLVANAVSIGHSNGGNFGYYNVEPVVLREMKEAQGMVKHPSTMPPYVCGAAYEISQAQLEIMDTYERGYSRELHRCTDLSDATAAPLECWTYIAQHTSEELLPSHEYQSRVLEGADILPPEYIECIRAIPTNPLRSPRQDKRLRKEL
ncbi:AIG2-like family, putative [Leishmania donovani]|uniref:gamma-glutamylcyclotransferase n=1 Tax=Leishmania donovani TaxID=5661 RepID=A0A3Q8IAR7_LEIDO|nr:AIG2-like family, putative [Leishmania donovani]